VATGEARRRGSRGAAACVEDDAATGNDARRRMGQVVTGIDWSSQCGGDGALGRWRGSRVHARAGGRVRWRLGTGSSGSEGSGGSGEWLIPRRARRQWERRGVSTVEEKGRRRRRGARLPVSRG
jgi:hypothetical protein